MSDVVDPWFWIIGIVDAYGAIHMEKLRLGDTRMHGDFWPGTHHKRWRFNIKQWDMMNSPLSAGRLTIEEYDSVMAKIYKMVTPPKWVQWNDTWDAAGRPRGKAYDRLQAKFERDYANRNGVSANPPRDPRDGEKDL